MISKFGVKPGKGDTKTVIFMYSILLCENKHSDWVSCLNEGNLNFTMMISFFAHVILGFFKSKIMKSFEYPNFS